MHEYEDIRLFSRIDRVPNQANDTSIHIYLKHEEVPLRTFEIITPTTMEVLHMK